MTVFPFLKRLYFKYSQSLQCIVCIFVALISLYDIKALANVHTKIKRYEDKSNRGFPYFFTYCRSFNFDLNLYAPYIDLSNKEKYYWNRAVLFISHYGLSDALVEPFVNLMMHEVICKFSKWTKYCKDKEAYQKLQAYGPNFFRHKNYIKDIIKVLQ